MDLTGIGKLYAADGKELAKLYDNSGHVIWQRNVIAAGTNLWGPGFSYLDATDYPRSYPMPISDIDKGINVSFDSTIAILGTAPDGVTAKSTVLFLPAEYRVYQLRIQWNDRETYSVDLKIELTSNPWFCMSPQIGSQESSPALSEEYLHHKYKEVTKWQTTRGDSYATKLQMANQ